MVEQTQFEELRNWMQTTQAAQAQQLTLLKKQLLIFRLFTLVLLVGAIVMIFTLGTTFARLDRTLADIEVISSQLADTDWPNMMIQIEQLVQSSQISIDLATDQLQSIDFKTLNQSIQDLHSIVEPLARLFG